MMFHHLLSNTLTKVEIVLDSVDKRTPLLVDKARVAPDMTLRFTTHKQVRMQAREPPSL